MDADKVLECLIKAKERRETDHPIVIQSDRGVQYTSELYQRLTKGMVVLAIHGKELHGAMRALNLFIP